MASTDPNTAESRRFSIRLPRPLWIGVATAVIVVGPWLALAWRQTVSAEAIRLLGGEVKYAWTTSFWDFRWNMHDIGDAIPVATENLPSDADTGTFYARATDF